ncbi:MAG: S-layer homology domain-containing protein [Oscillibacter sp.]|jgi:hypothetical protein|nr:S-layer homology domain-containing protein [Oscillibacter sp.]
MKRHTKLTALILAACLTVSLLAVPAGAASAVTSFSDVTDAGVAVSVETLRLLGVLDGYSDGSFRPGNTLTRAQFCKMAVYVLNAGGEAGAYRATTIFPDVKPSHWAAAYINLAAKGKKIIAGFADGYFRPNRTVTYGQAVTILMRILGYADADMGTVWPDGYIAQAGVVGLTDGVSLSGGDALNRGNAARLFSNLLRCSMKDDSAYAASIASIKEDVMLVDSRALAPNGTNTAMQTGAGDIYEMANKPSSGLLNGRKGILLLDKKTGKVLTFVPYSVGSNQTVTVSSVTSLQLTDTSGRKYAVAKDVMVYRDGAEEKWSTAYAWLTPGTTVTLYLGSSGNVEYVLAGSGSVASAAVVAASRGSTEGFSALAGGSGSYRIYKDGVAADAGDVRQYDVATYSSATNTIRVCDTRITGYYEACTPNRSAPEKVTVLGHEFPVLASAYDTISKFDLGSQITLLLTEDNQVAGAVSASGSFGADGNALGIAQSVGTSSATVKLLCGITVKGDVSLSGAEAGSLSGQLVRVSSGSRGTLNLNKVTGGTGGELNVLKKTLGSRTLRDNVLIYRQSGGTLTPVALSALNADVIPASGIVCSVTDWANRVSVLVVGNVSGSQYLYGLAKYEKVTVGDSFGTHVTGSVTLDAGGTSHGPYQTGYPIEDGTFIGITAAADSDSLSGYTTLTKLSNISNSAWVGSSAVTAGGKTCSVPSGVLCYNRASKTWITLSQAHAYASVSNLYVDDYSVVRVVEVG